MTTVLCVDDDRHLNDLLRYALSREGWSIRTAETGQDALRILRMAPADVIILDVKLPDMNGFDVLSRLRLISAAPVIMLTALSEENDTLKGFSRPSGSCNSCKAPSGRSTPARSRRTSGTCAASSANFPARRSRFRPSAAPDTA